MRERERQTVVRPFPRRVGRPTPITHTPFFLLALRISERGATPERELCLGAPPPPSSPGPESTRTLSAPTAPPPPFAVADVVCYVERFSLSPGHTALPSPTGGLEGGGVGPCQSRLWACEGGTTCWRILHRCRLRWHHGEKLSENRDAILFTHVEDTRAASFFSVSVSTVNLVRLLFPTYPALASPYPAPTCPSRVQVKLQSKPSLLPPTRQVYHHRYAQTA